MSPDEEKLRLREVLVYQALADPVNAASEAANARKARARILRWIIEASS
jgi:hypothetical protein